MATIAIDTTQRLASNGPKDEFYISESGSISQQVTSPGALMILSTGDPAAEGIA